MSTKEKEMAGLLAKTHRNERLSAVVSHVNPNVSAILDLGCGIGALTTRLAKRFPSTLVVLHEIFHFKGAEVLIRTFQSVSHLLKKDGELIILDHYNPGNAPISFKLPEELRNKLHEFQSKFKPRKITYYDSGEGWIRTSMRDFYDFITKIWALNSGLEEEEMNETHTPFTRQKLENLVQDAGFKVAHTISLTPIDRHLEYYGITVEPTVKLPNRHILLKARKRVE